MNSVPANQTVSRTTYGIAVREACRLPETFIREHAHRIDRAFNAGEPIWCIVDELKMIHATRPTWKPTKTPRQLAKRVMKLHDRTITDIKRWVEG